MSEYSILGSVYRETHVFFFLVKLERITTIGYLVDIDVTSTVMSW